MRRLHTAVGAGVLLLAVTACADEQPDIGFGGQPDVPPEASGPVEPKPEAEREPVPATAIKDARDSGGKPPQVWTQDGGSVVVTIGEEGGCSSVHAEVAEQNDKKVKVVLVEETPEPTGICTMDLRYPPVAVRLDAPLDQRTVVLEARDVKVPK